MSPWRRRPLLPHRARVVLAFTCGSLAFVLALGALAEPPEAAQEPAPRTPIAEGRVLYDLGCASCHGVDARGLRGVAPSLRGVGAAAADFYVRTGRMPMEDPEDQPRRKESPYSERQIDALVAYVASFGGPPVPEVDPAAGSLREGFELFAEHCAGCHQVVAQGGLTTRGWVPDLQGVTAVDVAEAMEIGPYLMPRFGELFSDDEVDSIARYVLSTRDPEDVGGWGLGHIGPIPEGMVAWLLAGAALILAIRLIGERTR